MKSTSNCVCVYIQLLRSKLLNNCLVQDKVFNSEVFVYVGLIRFSNYLDNGTNYSIYIYNKFAALQFVFVMFKFV